MLGLSIRSVAVLAALAALVWRLDDAADVALQAVFQRANRHVIRGARQPINILITRAGMAAGNGAAAIPEHVVMFAERILNPRTRRADVRRDHLGHRAFRGTRVVGALLRVNRVDLAIAGVGISPRGHVATVLAAAHFPGRVKRGVFAELVPDGGRLREGQQELEPDMPVEAVRGAVVSAAPAANAIAVGAAFPRRPLRHDHVGGREETMDVVVVVLRQCDLLEVVATLNPPGRFARRLHGWQQERDQDRDDRDHDQQLDERKTVPPRRHGSSFTAGELVQQRELENEPLLRPHCRSRRGVRDLGTCENLSLRPLRSGQSTTMRK